ncbi:MAG TPA: choice-of-anchor B family protein [Acidobacteriota bacterium]
MKKLLASLALVVLILLSTAPAWAQSGYGSSVAVGDGELFVGESRNRISSGFVYVYRPGPNGWREVAKLLASDATNRDGFGGAVAVEGDTLAVASNAGNGTVYVFRRDGGEWTEVGRLTNADGAEGDQFGSSVAISGDTMIIGAAGHNEREGAAYVFRRQGSSWTQAAKLIATNPSEDEEQGGGRRGGGGRGQAGGGGDEGGRGGRGGNQPPAFGSTVAIDGDWAMVAAPNYSSRAGSVYVFRRDGQSWEQVAQLPGNFAEQGAGFGTAIVLGDGEAFIGAGGAHGGIGGVAVYELVDDGSWSQTGNLAPFDGERGSGFGSSIVIDGRQAFIGAPGAAGREGRIYRYERDESGRWSDATKLGADDLEPGDSFGAALAGRGDVLVAAVPRDDFGAGTAVVMSRTDFGWSDTKIFSPIANYPMVTGGGIECSGGMAGDFPCDNVDLVAFLPVHEIGGVRGLGTNDLWGWTDPETGRDYAIAGLRDRASFVDVTDPYNPVHVGILMKTEGSRASSWRDMKIRNNWVYIVSDGSGEHGMQIFNLEHLREFAGEPMEFSADALYDAIGSAHNIVINPETDYAYIVGAGGPNGCGGGLHIVNIEDPTNPTFEGCFQHMNTGRRGTGYSHDAMCVSYDGPDERYAGHEICFGANETALSIADVTDKRSPVALGMATYPNVAYTHQGWITDDHKYFYMNDELDEGRDLVPGTRTLIWDVQDLEDPILVKEYISDNPATDHNLYVRGRYMYQSNYDSGLRVYDVSDAENPEPVGFFDTVPYQEGAGMTGSWSNYPYFDSGVIVVTSGSEGLLIVKLRDAR